jgi:hypothetical protein
MIDLMPGFGAFTPAVSGGSAATWNPADKSADVTLSGADLVATYTDAGSNAYDNVRATVGKSSGKYYSEHTVAYTNNDQRSLGVANSSASLTSYSGVDTNSIGFYMDGTVYYGNSLITTLQTTTPGQRVDMAVDLDNGTIWWRTNNGNWNNSGTANPATNTEGVTIGVAGTVYPFTSLRQFAAPDSDTAVFLSTSWAGTPPAGFGQWSA